MSNKSVSKYLNVVLEDDFTNPFRGLSFEGQTLGDFLEEVGAERETNMDKVNVMLKMCGISPIKLD